MRYFSLVPVVAGAIMIAGALGSVTAQAASYYGPLVKGDGQCWHTSYGVGSPAIGYWGDCKRDNPSLFRSERSIHSDKMKGRPAY
jgi:hypothetical protein